MSAVLRTSRDLPAADAYDVWIALAGARPQLDTGRRLAGLADRLEAAYLQIRPVWWELGRALGADPGAEIARAPTAAVFGSDFGIMLAWDRIAQSLASEEPRYLMVCDDPWLFRQLATRPGIAAGRPPALWPRQLVLGLRGWLVRARVAALMARTALALRRQRSAMPSAAATILVYAHPASSTEGGDAYFGLLMREMPDLKRVLHVDATLSDVRGLAGDERTVGVHAWGDPLTALGLLFRRWWPRQNHGRGPYGWLVRRAAAMENGGGGPAMTHWQIHCQERWLQDTRPAVIAWPWENHAWERALCRAARRAGVRTVGYQHTVIGPHQINYSTASNPDGLDSIPDAIVADGPAYARELAAWGIPADRLSIGGAFRFKRHQAVVHDPAGPVFVPLSANRDTARQQLEAARRIAASGRHVLVKDHPMYPMTVAEEPRLTSTDVPLTEQKVLSTVLYSTGTSGLEAVLMGLPAVRLQLEDRIAVDVLPEGIKVPVATLETVAEAVATLPARPAVRWEEVLAPVDMSVWRRLLEPQATPAPAPGPSIRCAS